MVKHSEAVVNMARSSSDCKLQTELSPVSIQTQSLALRKQKPQETPALALASSQSWLPLLRPSIPIGWRLCNHDWLLANTMRFSFTQRKRLRLNGNQALVAWFS